MATKGTTTRAAIYTRKSSLDDRSGAGGLVFAAVITGIFHRMRRENDAAHGEAIAKLDDIATTVHEIDDQLDGITVWQEKHQELHDRTPR